MTSTMLEPNQTFENFKLEASGVLAKLKNAPAPDSVETWLLQLWVEGAMVSEVAALYAKLKTSGRVDFSLKIANVLDTLNLRLAKEQKIIETLAAKLTSALFVGSPAAHLLKNAQSTTEQLNRALAKKSIYEQYIGQINTSATRGKTPKQNYETLQTSAISHMVQLSGRVSFGGSFTATNTQAIQLMLTNITRLKALSEVMSIIRLER